MASQRSLFLLVLLVAAAWCLASSAAAASAANGAPASGSGASTSSSGSSKSSGNPMTPRPGGKSAGGSKGAGANNTKSAGANKGSGTNGGKSAGPGKVPSKSPGATNGAKSGSNGTGSSTTSKNGTKSGAGGSQNGGGAGKTNSTVTAFDRAVQKLNETGYTQFAALAKLYGQLQQVRSVLSQPLTLLVPSNAALNKLKVTSYSATQLATLVSYQAIQGVYTFRQLQMLRPNTPVATVAIDNDRKPLVLVKASRAGVKNQVVLQGRAAPRSTIAIVTGDVFYVAKKLAVHTTDAVVFPNGIY